MVRAAVRALILSVLLLSALVLGVVASAEHTDVGNTPRQLESYAVLASDLLWLGNGVSVESGHVGVNEKRTASWWWDRPIEAFVGARVTVDTESALVADTVVFGQNGSFGHVFANDALGADPRGSTGGG